MEKTGYKVSSNSEKWPIKSETFQDQSVFSCHCEQSEQGFLWIVRMTGAWCRLVSWRCRHNVPRLGAWKPALNLGKSWEWSGVVCTVQWCVWIFPVSVRTICLPSSLNFLQPRVTLTQVRARGESWDGITITKNITQDKNIYQSFESLWILTQCNVSLFETRVNQTIQGWRRAELFRRYLELAQFTYGCHVRSGCKYLNTRIRPHFCDYNDKPVKSEAFTWNTVTY